MRRVSSLLRARAAPAGASFPLISTSGGFPGEKNRSLTFAEVLSIEAKSSGVEIGAAAGAAAAAPAALAATAGAEAGTALGGRFAGFVGEDIEGLALALFSRSYYTPGQVGRSCALCSI